MKPVSPRAAAAAGKVLLVQRESQVERSPSLEAQLVQEDDLLALPPHQQRLGRLRGRRPAGEEGIEILPAGRSAKPACRSAGCPSWRPSTGTRSARYTRPEGSSRVEIHEGDLSGPQGRGRSLDHMGCQAYSRPRHRQALDAACVE